MQLLGRRLSSEGLCVKINAGFWLILATFLGPLEAVFSPLYPQKGVFWLKSLVGLLWIASGVFGTSEISIFGVY